MSFDWANALLFRLSGSGLAANSRGGETHSHTRQSGTGNDPNYERLLMLAKSFNPDWRTITLNVARDASAPVSATIDTGTGGQPQKRTQYLLNRETGVVVKTSTFSSGNLGQRLRAIVRFGHTGEYYGSAGQGSRPSLLSAPACWCTPACRCQSADLQPSSSAKKQLFQRTKTSTRTKWPKVPLNSTNRQKTGGLNCGNPTRVELLGSLMPIPRRFQMKLSRRNLLNAALGMRAATWLLSYCATAAPHAGQVKITKIKTMGLDNLGDGCLIRIETDAGVVGYGEAGLPSAAARTLRRPAMKTSGRRCLR
jgi:hypothetical protein